MGYATPERTALLKDGTLTFTNGTTMPFTGAQAMLKTLSAWDGLSLIYILRYENITPLVAHVVNHMPHNTARARMSWDALISPDGRFFDFTVNTAAGRTRFHLLRNLLRDDYRREKARTEDDMLDILRLYESHGLLAMTAGAASMRAYTEGRIPRYRRRFPQLDKETALSLRSAYIGGYMQAKPGEYGPCLDVDCNSMYPYVLANMPMPYDMPEHYEGEYEQDDDMPLHVDVITFRAMLKEDGYPILVDGSRMMSRADRLVDTKGYVTRALTDVDQRLLEENYDVRIYRHEHGWKFRASRGLFTWFVDEWGDMKRHSAGHARQMAKLIMNALVGKMASLPRDVCMLPKSDDGVTLDYEPGDGRERQGLEYLPVPLFVNANARRLLIDMLRANADRVIHANTDGAILEGSEPPEGVKLDPGELGAWKTIPYERATVLGLNEYQAEREDGQIDLIMSGMSFEKPIPWKSYKHGSVVKDMFGQSITL